ncbi:MAG TPA: hypothetical protein DEA32_01130 [Firmicutes bacterium]|nr:hypothetical protein [Bacillota bacterium]
MNRLRPVREIYPLFAILTFVLITIAGLIAAGSYYLWVYPVFLFIFFIAIGYWRAALSSLVCLVFFSLFTVGITALATQDVHEIEDAAFRSVIVVAGSIPLLGMSYETLAKNLDTLKCPRTFALAVLVVFYFFPILNSERRKILMAYRIRGGNPHLPFVFFKALVTTMLLRTMSVADSLTLSLETRGFEVRNKPAVIYRPVVPRAADWAYITFILLLASSLLGVGLWLR